MTTVLTPAALRTFAKGAGFTDDPAAPDQTIAVAVALAESGGRVDATHQNANGSTDYGLWQINSIHSDLLAHFAWANATDNARMAFQIFKDAHYRWAPWATYASGAYKKFMTVAQQSGDHGVWVTVNPGDTLWSIAAKQLGDGKNWPIIWHAPQNAAVVALRLIPERLQAGDKLYVPL